jgi:hypothetical protein
VVSNQRRKAKEHPMSINLKDRNFIVKGLTALNDACDKHGFDKSSLDLSEFDRSEAKAINTFIAKVKRGADFNTVKNNFKSYCLGTPVTLPTGNKEKEAPKSAKVAHAEAKEGKSEKIVPKEKVATVVNDPLVHEGVGDLTVDLRHGKVTLFDAEIMVFKYDLKKRQDAYEINFKWTTVKGHPLTDRVLLPHKTAPSDKALAMWIGKIARKLVLVYLSPYDTMPHPADSQGIINDTERTW